MQNGCYLDAPGLHESAVDTILKFVNIRKRFGYVVALDDVSFSVKKGEVHCIVGENGAGKSTLIKCLSGAYQADSGYIELDGERMTAPTPFHAIELGVSVVYQDLSVQPYMTVADNIMLGTEFNTVGFLQRAKNIAAVKPYLEKVGLDIDPKVPMQNLSLAQQQMVVIAKALYKKAKVLVLDEPTSMLSDGEVKILFKIIRGLREQGIAILYISHRLQELYEIGDHVTVLKDGKIVGTYAIPEVSSGQLITKMVGRELVDIYPERGRVRGDTLLEVKGLTTSKIKDISFKLHAGEIIGLSGLVGSGRSEVLNAIMGSDPKISGTVLVKNKMININHPSQAIRMKIGMVPEDRRGQGMIGCLSVQENIISIYSCMTSRFGFLQRKNSRRVAAKYIKELTINPPIPTQTMANLSGGNQQKVIMAKWLCMEPEIILLDEPTQGIDVGTKAELYQIIDALARKGLGVILVSSDMMEILNLSDRILVMRDGQIVRELNGYTATENEVLSYAMR